MYFIYFTKQACCNMLMLSTAYVGWAAGARMRVKPSQSSGEACFMNTDCVQPVFEGCGRITT